MGPWFSAVGQIIQSRSQSIVDLTIEIGLWIFKDQKWNKICFNRSDGWYHSTVTIWLQENHFPLTCMHTLLSSYYYYDLRSHHVFLSSFVGHYFLHPTSTQKCAFRIITTFCTSWCVLWYNLCGLNVHFL